MITGNEPYNIEMQPDSTPSEQIFYRPNGGLTIFQELSARFMCELLSGNFKHSAESACYAAEALINEWNKRAES